MTDTPPPAAPHTPSDDPRVVARTQTALRRFAERIPQRIARDDARDLLARLDAAVPARDDALDRWLDTEIAEADRLATGVRMWQPIAAAENRAEVLREVRARLGADTDTDKPEEGSDGR